MTKKNRSLIGQSSYIHLKHSDNKRGETNIKVRQQLLADKINLISSIGHRLGLTEEHLIADEK